MTPCIHLLFLPLLQPTQYTYTQALESFSHRRIHLTHFTSLCCPLVCCKSFCDELDVVMGIFFSKLKKKKSQLLIIATSLAHHKASTTSVVITPNLPHGVEEKSWKNNTVSPLSLYRSSLLSLSASLLVHPWLLLLRLSHRLHHMHLFQ